MVDLATLKADLPYAISALLALLALLFFWLARKPKVRLERRALLTKAELDVFAILTAELPDHHISCQVAMGALLKPRPGLSRKSYSLSRNKVSQKVVDFVVMDPETGFVEAIIELDDSTHDAAKDARRDALMAQGEYPVIRIPSKPRPTRENVAKRLLPLTR